VHGVQDAFTAKGPSFAYYVKAEVRQISLTLQVIKRIGMVQGFTESSNNVE
ncbi:uncharacterized protein METZ01_LOCUS120404, partial [marine metagenome]